MERHNEWSRRGAGDDLRVKTLTTEETSTCRCHSICLCIGDEQIVFRSIRCVDRGKTIFVEAWALRIAAVHSEKCWDEPEMTSCQLRDLDFIS